MERDKVLWLASWYPTEVDPYNGDFIQRHAIATSAFIDIDLFHVLHETFIIKNEVISTAVQPALVEHCIKIKKKGGWVGRVYGVFQYFFCFKNALEDHIRQQGKPLCVHVHVPVRAGMMAVYLKWRYGIRFIVSEHFGIYNDSERSFCKRNFIFKWLTRTIVHQSEILVTVSSDLGKAMNDMVVRKDHLVIPNVVDTSLFYYKHHQQNVGEFIFLHASTMQLVKNVEGIIRAFAMIAEKEPKAELVLLGNNGLRILEQVKNAGIAARTTVMGMSSYQVVAEWMRKADAFVMFSRSENAPCVISEAHCCGVPVIATAVGGIPEMINDTNGILIKSQDEVSLFNAMIRMISERSRYDRRSISDKAIHRYSYQFVGQRISELYHSFRKDHNVS